MSKIYIFVFIMMLIAYLSPKEEYRKLFQFFVGGVMAVMLIFPIIQWIYKDEMASDILQWQETKQKIESIYYEPEQEVDIFSYVDELENQGQTEELEVE